jgi:peroxiredoxin family protein
MKRLTKRCNGVVTYVGASSKYETGKIACEVDPQGVRELLDRVAAYEDTTVTPVMCAEYKKFEDEAISKGITIKRIIELMNADAAGRVAILPCEVGGAMLDVSDPEHPQEMKEIHFSVSYVSSGIVFSQPMNIFLENIAAGYIKSMEGRDDDQG